MSDLTREEAKELFEDNFTVINTHGHYTKEEEGQAQELAISALSENKIAKIENTTVDELKDILKWGHCYCDSENLSAYKAIKNAIAIITSLERLKAEIKNNTEHCECVPDGSCIRVDKVLEIIDKHIGGASK